MSWQCPCGCALQLTRTDLANEWRLIAILGPTPRKADIRCIGTQSRFEKAAIEPTEKGVCRSCGSPMELFVYLAEILRSRRAPWPLCEQCTKGDT